MDEEANKRLDEVILALGHLVVVIGMVDAAIDSTEREELRESWDERLQELARKAQTEAGELIEFGSAYD